MLGLDARAARATWTVFVVLLGLWLVYALREALLLFVGAILFAYLLMPLVDWVSRYTPPKVSHVWSLAIVYVVFLTIVILAVINIGSEVADQAGALANRIPELVKSQGSLSTIPLPSWLEPSRGKVVEMLRAKLEAGAGEILPFVQRAGLHLLSGLGSLLSVVLVPILSFLFLKDGREIRDSILESVEDLRRRAVLERIFADVHTLLGLYIRALVLLAAATFIFYMGFFSITGVPYSLLLATMSAMLEFIPVVGPLLAAIIVLAVAGFAGFPHVLWLLIFFGVYRLFQDYVLQPYLMSSGIELHPLLVLFGALAGEQIGGVMGMFLSIPVLATLRVVYLNASRKSSAAA